MTENEKAKELIATSETTVKVYPQNGWYLKRFAALQFEGSVDNFSTNMPIHVLEQQLPKDDTMKNISYISCPSCGFIMKPVWYLEKELDTHGIPTGRTHKACSCLLCDSCGHKETVDGSFDEPYK